MKKAEVKVGEKYLARFRPVNGACVTVVEPPDQGGRIKVSVLLQGMNYTTKIGSEWFVSTRNLVRPWTKDDDRARETRAEARVREGKVLERAKMVDTTAVIHNGRVLISVDAVESLLRASGHWTMYSIDKKLEVDR